MVIFVDESGIHKSKDHSCLALVYIEIKNLSVTEKQITNIENNLNIKFHWSHSSWQVREKFFSEIKKLNFSVKIAIIENPLNWQKEFESALQHLIIERNIKQIIIDGKKSKRYEKKFKKILRDKGISVKKLKTANDESFAGIRLADAIAGVARHFHDNPAGKAKKLYSNIKPKILIILQK